MSAADRVRALFQEATGEAPAVVSSAPGRVNLIGEHTDYNGGLVLPIAIGARSHVAATPRSDGRLRGWSAQIPEAFDTRLAGLAPGRLRGWPAYACGPAWVLMRTGRNLSGADLLVDSEVPLGAGLASSAALQTAVALALSALAGEPVEGKDLAMVAHRSENEFVGVPCGLMDPMISALGRKDHALLLNTGEVRVEYVPFDPAPEGLALLVVDTGVAHSLPESEYAQRRRTCEEAARALGLSSLRGASLNDLTSGSLTDLQLRRARHVVTENLRVLEAVDALSRRDFSAVGSAFNRSHASLRDDYEVSSEELDLAVESARASGAWGARMTGAGFGGSAIALVPDVNRTAFIEAVAHAFADAGFRPPRTFAVHAERGASVDLR